VYDKPENGLTKNDLFSEMMRNAKEEKEGLRP
jgi:hypothetical protein